MKNGASRFYESIIPRQLSRKDKVIRAKFLKKVPEWEKQIWWVQTMSETLKNYIIVLDYVNKMMGVLSGANRNVSKWTL